jgi:exoribonuclease R
MDRARGGKNSGSGRNNSYGSNQRQQDQKQSGNYRAVYDDYMGKEEVLQRLTVGSLLKGTVRVSPKKRKVAYITCEGVLIDVCIDDEKLRNRAFAGDLVAVELLPETEWLQLTKSAGTGAASTSEETTVAELLLTPKNENSAEIQKGLWQPREDIIAQYGNSQRNTDGTPSSEEGSNTTVKELHPVDVKSMQLCLQPRGRVVYILESNHPDNLVGSLVAQCTITPGKGFPESESFVFFNPTDQRYPNLVIPRLQLPESYLNDPHRGQKHIYQAKISSPWPKTSKLPSGCDIRSIGEMGSIQAETDALLIENGVNHGLFTDEHLEPLRALLRGIGAADGYGQGQGQGQGQGADPANIVDATDRTVQWVIPEDEIARRRDLRAYRIFTIDPPNAKDLDDALHITPLDDGTYEIG